MSDPVASKSTFLCMYMSSHPDTLVAYVKHFGKVSGNVSSAQMKSIDCKGMNLSYTLKGGEVGSVHVEFDTPLAGYDDVKPRLLSMKADAQEALGMLKSPKLTSFYLPSLAAPIILLLLGSAYVSSAPPRGTVLPFLSAGVSDTLFTPARSIVNMIGFQPSLKIICQITGVAHGLESLYAYYLCRKHVKGAFLTAVYVSATFIIGFPVLNEIKKRVQAKRIESVMKAE